MASKRISEDMFKNICQNLLHHPERMLRDKNHYLCEYAGQGSNTKI